MEEGEVEGSVGVVEDAAAFCASLLFDAGAADGGELLLLLLFIAPVDVVVTPLESAGSSFTRVVG